MGTCQINHRQASDLVLTLEKAGLIPPLAAKVIEDGSGALATVMVTALASALGVYIVQPSDKLASQRRSWWKRHLKRLGIKNVLVPVPNVTDDEINRRTMLPIPQKLFFNHVKTQAHYDTFMTAVGQGAHWTVTDQAERAKIGWESSKQGYWFWAEVASNTPRLNPPSSWNDLTKAIRLLSLEEYVIVWHFLKSTNIMLDVPTWNWLRTRYNGSGALDASELDGRVNVGRYGAGHLSVAYDYLGGRLAEVVN